MPLLQSTTSTVSDPLSLAKSSLAGVYKLPNINSPGVAARYKEALTGRTVLATAGVRQIADFAFDYKGDESVSMDNEVTDNWLEDNSAVQDHIGVKPVVVTLNGFVSELKFEKGLLGAITTSLSTLQSTLSRTDAYLGRYTPGATDALAKAISKAQSVAVQIEQAAARAAQIASFFPGGPSQNAQQRAYMKLSALRNARVVFTVFTPFQVFDNMAITSLKATQSARTRTMSDFTVTLKQLQFVQDVRQAIIQNKAGRAAAAVQAPSFNGSTAGLAAQGVSALKTALRSSFI